MPKINSDSYVVDSNPKAVNVEQEAEKIGKIGFNAKKIADALVKIGEVMYGLPLYDYQKEPARRIIYSMLMNDGAEITMLFARQSGKSEIIAFTVITIAVFFPVLAKVFPKQLSQYKDGVKIGLIAPQLDQADTVYSRVLDRIWRKETLIFLSDPDIADAPLSVRNFKLKSGSFLKAQSGAKQSKIESKTYHLIFIDEAQDMDREKVRKSIMPMLASTYGTLVRVGTPNREKGDFYEVIQQNKLHDKKLSTAKRKYLGLHFEYDYQRVIKDKKKQFKKDGKRFHTLYKKAVDRDKKTMGEDSDDFLLSYKLKWLLSEGMFITYDTLEERVLDKRLNFKRPDEVEGFVIAGLDIASARNSTVLALGEMEQPITEIEMKLPKQVIEFLELRNMTYEQQFNIIVDYLVEYNVEILYADYTGVGRPVVDRLLDVLGERILIIPYMFSVPSKSMMWQQLDEDIKAGRLIVPYSKEAQRTDKLKEFTKQMLGLSKRWHGKYMICQKTAGTRDDYPDAVGLMNLAGNFIFTETMEVEISQNEKFSKIAEINKYKYF